jgi:hypothetical protein
MAADFLEVEGGLVDKGSTVPKGWGVVILGTIGVVAVVVIVGMWVDRRWGILPRPGELAAVEKAEPPDPPGTVASAPLRLTPKKLARALVAQKCAGCGARVAASEGEPVRYGAHELRLYRLTCPACGVGRGLYVNVV